MKLIPKHQNGNIISRKGDPYQYKKESGKFFYKTGTKDWIQADSKRSNVISKLFSSKNTSNEQIPASNTASKYVDFHIKSVTQPNLLNQWQFGNPKTTYLNNKVAIENNNKHLLTEQNLEKKMKTQAIQNILRNAGYKISADGVWGEQTEKAYTNYLTKQPTPIPKITPESDSHKIIKAITHPINFLGSKLRDSLSSSSSSTIGQAAPMVADIMGVSEPMTEKSFTPEEINIFRKIKSNPDNPYIKDFETVDSTGKKIIIPAKQRRENTEAHFMYYQQFGTPEEKLAAYSLMNKIGQGVVKNIGTTEPIDYYNWNKNTSDEFKDDDILQELKQRPNENTNSYLKRIGTRYIGPTFWTVSTPENDKIGQPVIISNIKKGGLIPKGQNGLSILDMFKPKPESDVEHIYKNYDQLKNGRHTINTIRPESLTRNINEIIKYSIDSNINPYLALAISDEETNLGQYGNPLPDGNTALYHLNPKIYGVPAGRSDIGMKALKSQLDYGLSLQKRNIIPNTTAHLYQSFQGFHLPSNSRELQGKYRGVTIPKGGLDLKKNPLYGKDIVKKIDKFKKTPKINKVVNDYAISKLSKPSPLNFSLYD